MIINWIENWKRQGKKLLKCNAQAFVYIIYSLGNIFQNKIVPVHVWLSFLSKENVHHAYLHCFCWVVLLRATDQRCNLYFVLPVCLYYHIFIVEQNYMYTIIYQSYQFLKFYVYIFFVFSSVMFLFSGKKNYVI
jgi:hypothetical protein